MAQFRQFRQFQIGNLGWRGWLGLIVGGALALAAAVALVILSLGLALILIPIVAIAALYGRWKLGKAVAEMNAQATRPGAGRTIEIEYDVVDDRDGESRR
jgi:hypothetical protein